MYASVLAILVALPFAIALVLNTACCGQPTPHAPRTPRRSGRIRGMKRRTLPMAVPVAVLAQAMKSAFA